MNKYLNKLISLLLVVTLSFGFSPKVNADNNEVHYLAFASDYHNTKGSIYNAMKSMPDSVEYVSLIGDMYGERGGDHPAYDSAEIMGYVQEVFPNLDNSNISIIWADHDASVNDEGTGIVKCKEGLTSEVIYTGYNSDGSIAYYIYSVGFYHMLNGGETSQNAANVFKTWVDTTDPSIPIIVLCHAPIQAKRGDNHGASYWNEALNYAATGTEGIDTTEENGTIIRDVFFLHGHNHTNDPTEYYFPAGSIMSVQADKSAEVAAAMQNNQNSQSENQNNEQNENTQPETQSNESLLSSPPEKPDGEGEPPEGERPSAPPGGERIVEGVDSNVYYNVLTAGYLKTSGNATLITISDNQISLVKYNGDDTVSLGTDGQANGMTDISVIIDHVVHKGSDTVIENIINPTCGNNGSYDEVVYCNDCEIELSRKQIITSALGHDLSEWVTTIEPTVDSYGEETRTCSRCGYREIRSIAPLIYVVSQGNGNIWFNKSNNSCRFVFKRVTNDDISFDHFEGIYIDGIKVDSIYYTVEKGSVIINISADYLKTLSLGPHIVTAMFNDGNNPNANFFIQDGYRVPLTGIE